MGNELVTLNRTLPIHNGTVGPTDGNSLINYFISVAVLAEMAVSNADSAPWIVDERLNKRRNSYELDKHLQNMLLFLDGKNGVSAKCIPCGRNNLLNRSNALLCLQRAKLAQIATSQEALASQGFSERLQLPLEF